MLYITVYFEINFISCNRIAYKTKESINKSGEVVRETALEFFKDERAKAILQMLCESQKRKDFKVVS